MPGSFRWLHHVPVRHSTFSFGDEGADVHASSRQFHGPEGPACQVRSPPIECPSLVIGHDRRAPPRFTARRGKCPSNRPGFHAD